MLKWIIGLHYYSRWREEVGFDLDKYTIISSCVNARWDQSNHLCSFLMSLPHFLFHDERTYQTQSVLDCPLEVWNPNCNFPVTVIPRFHQACRQKTNTNMEKDTMLFSCLQSWFNSMNSFHLWVLICVFESTSFLSGDKMISLQSLFNICSFSHILYNIGCRLLVCG